MVRKQARVPVGAERRDGVRGELLGAKGGVRRAHDLARAGVGDSLLALSPSVNHWCVKN